MRIKRRYPEGGALCRPTSRQRAGRAACHRIIAARRIWIASHRRPSIRAISRGRSRRIDVARIRISTTMSMQPMREAGVTPFAVGRLRLRARSRTQSAPGLSAQAPAITLDHPSPRHPMKPRLPVVGIFLACGLALLTAGCVSAPTRAASVADFRTYGIIAVDDRGPLSPPELDRIQFGVVQYLLSEGFVHGGQVFVSDLRRADVVFQVTIAWQGAGNSYAIVGVALTDNGIMVAGAAPAAPLYSGAPYYEPWYDDYYDYPDFGYAYEPYLPLIGFAPWIPFLGHSYHGRSYHPDYRDHRGSAHRPGGRDWERRVPWRRDDRRPGDSWRAGDRRHSSTPPLQPRGLDLDKRRPAPGTWHPHDSRTGPRPPAANPPARSPDRTGLGSRPPPRRTDRDAHRPPAEHRSPPAAVTPRPSLPDRRSSPAAVTSRPPPSGRRSPPAAVTSRPPPDRRGPPPAVAHRPPPDRVERPSSRDSSVRRPAERRANPDPTPRREYAARPAARPSSERSAPPPRRTESSSVSRRSDSGHGGSSSQGSRSDSRPSRSDSGDSDRRGRGRDH